MCRQPRTDSPITGRYSPANRLYWTWGRRAVSWSRAEYADALLTIRRQHGRGEARAFSDWCLWLGTHPTGSAWFRNQYTPWGSNRQT